MGTGADSRWPQISESDRDRQAYTDRMAGKAVQELVSLSTKTLKGEGREADRLKNRV